MLRESHPDYALLAHLRHELYTPINTINGYSELLLEELSRGTSRRWMTCFL